MVLGQAHFHVSGSRERAGASPLPPWREPVMLQRHRLSQRTPSSANECRTALCWPWQVAR
jgi:hypothetical protein